MRNLQATFLSIFTLLALVSLPLYSQISVDGTEAFGDRLVIGSVDQQWNDFNPFQIESTFKKNILHLIYGYGLLQREGKFQSPPSLIDRYVYRSDQQNTLEWRFVLKRNVIFQDGSDLRNTDVQFTYQVLKKFGGQILNRPVDFSNIRSISTDGDLEIVFRLFKPDKEFDQLLTDLPILSRNYYKQMINSGYQVFSQVIPMGLGPFRLVSAENEAINLTFHPHYFTGRPFLDNVSIRFYKDEQELLNALVNEDVDYVEIPDQVTARQLHQLMGSKIIVFTIPRPEIKVHFMLMNLTEFPFSLPEVRAAINYAINRRQIVDRLMKQNGEVAFTLFNEENPYFFKQAFRDEFDPALALATLKQAGWELDKQTGILTRNGKPLTFNLYFSQKSFLEESIARTIKIYLGELNINVQPIPVSPLRKREILENGEYSAIISDYSYDPEYLFQAVMDFYFNTLGRKNHTTNYKNIYLDRLLPIARDDPSVRKTFYQRFQFYLKRDLPAIFLFFDTRIIVAVNSRFRNVRTTFNENNNFFYRLIPFENWYVPKNLQKYAD